MNVMELLASTTVATLLGGADSDRAVDGLGRLLGQNEVAGRTLNTIGHLTRRTSQLLDHKIAAELQGLLDTLDLGDLVLGGWAHCQELIAAGRRTSAAPDRPEDVVLASQKIMSNHHPAVEVIVNGRSIGALVFDVEISLELHGVIAEVVAGRLTSIRCGEGVVAAQLCLEQRLLAKRDAPFAVGAVVSLRGGIPLARPVDVPKPWPAA